MSEQIEQHAPPDNAAKQDRRRLRTALLVCRDSRSLQWGPRWLEQSGFLTTIVEEPASAEQVARELQPSVIIVDAAARDADGRCLYESLPLCGNREPLPTIVLCANSRDVQVALDSPHVTELVRKPYDWNLVSRRAAAVADIEVQRKELTSAINALHSARAEAEVARMDLERSVECDELTGLASRAKFKRLLEQSLFVDRTESAGLSLLVVRINRFRLVNEALGHDNGNRVLVRVGERLRNCLSESAAVGQGLVTVATGRLGGVRFGVTVSRMSDAEDLSRLAHKILDILSLPVQIDGQSIYLSACVGAAVAPVDGETADQLLQHAEIALREAKQRGGGFSMFREPLVAGSARKLQLDSMLHEAIDRAQLYMEYQPLLQVSENRVVGAEALLRWHHPVEGCISPAEFIPIAEKNGLMTRVGAMVIDSACRQLRQWIDAGAEDLRMCINLSLYQLRHNDVVEVVERALHTSRLDPRQVELELSERGVVGRDSKVLSQLHRLKALGVRLSIDDFGTGESAIAYLKELPIDALKIDRSYISGAMRDGRDATIVAGMVALARRLGLTVVAEGVEAVEQLELLREWGCHQYQGFYFSQSVPGGRFLPLVNRADQRLSATEGSVPELA
ncbi:MAG: EAL domain-containing protein [Gammaproteobacteria bacterium]|nr:EAL domain-containing protein [Gammaproteobacteria bacterium]NNF60909.1 EAL domain-containing protein [Gammaproteobacteria bacterium]NNM20528.1 EAL domain-containing protein [Gammaproteobacteria bacterium]